MQLSSTGMPEVRASWPAGGRRPGCATRTWPLCGRPSRQGASQFVSVFINRALGVSVLSVALCVCEEQCQQPTALNITPASRWQRVGSGAARTGRGNWWELMHVMGDAFCCADVVVTASDIRRSTSQQNKTGDPGRHKHTALQMASHLGEGCGRQSSALGRYGTARSKHVRQLATRQLGAHGSRAVAKQLRS